jgi:hypothetical protein
MFKTGALAGKCKQESRMHKQPPLPIHEIGRGDQSCPFSCPVKSRKSIASRICSRFTAIHRMMIVAGELETGVE